MATITLTMSDATLDRVTTAISNRYGWERLIPAPPPPTRGAFAKDALIQLIKEMVVEEETTRSAPAPPNDIT